VESFDGTALLFMSAAATVGLDQLAKMAATNSLTEGQLRPVLGRNSGFIRRTTDRAVFLSLSVRQATFVWLSVVACLELVIVLGAPLTGARALGVGLVVGGAAGNLADRLARGRVVDFISIGHWRTFNLADAAMVLGLGVAAGSLL
jgi:signal peptidase II